MGVGMVAVLPADDVDRALAVLTARHVDGLGARRGAARRRRSGRRPRRPRPAPRRPSPVLTAAPDAGPPRTGADERMRAVRRLSTSPVRRLRTRGRSAAVRAIRLTGAAVAAFLVAELVGLDDPPPLIAALTALIVVQVTLTETLVNGLQRVASVVAGVLVALVFVSVVGLSWWSLGLLVGASIVVGQLLRLGPQLVEAPISAMLVLGVGYAGRRRDGGPGAGAGDAGRRGGRVGGEPGRAARGGEPLRRAGPAEAGRRDRRPAGLRGGGDPERAVLRTWPGAGWRTRGGSTGTCPGWTGRSRTPRRAASSTCGRWPSATAGSVCATGWRRWSTAR